MGNEKPFYLGIKAIIQNSEGQILLLKHSSGYWDFPGGRVNHGESIEDTLMREVEEETGITKLEEIKPDKMVLTKYQIPFQDVKAGLVLWYHTCTLPGEVEITLSNEHTEYRWVELSEAEEFLP